MFVRFGSIKRRALRPLFFGLTLVAGGHLVTPSTARAQGADERAGKPMAEEADGRAQADAADKRTRTPAQRKLDSQLLYAVKRSRGETRGLPTSHEALDLDAQGRVLVDISAIVSSRLAAAVRRVGGTVISESPKYHTIRARVALDKLETLALRKEIRFIAPAAKAMNNRGATTNQR